MTTFATSDMSALSCEGRTNGAGVVRGGSDASVDEEGGHTADRGVGEGRGTKRGTRGRERREGAHRLRGDEVHFELHGSPTGTSGPDAADRARVSVCERDVA